jgi:hypothetical protein
LYGCETWSLTISEEYKLKVFEKRVLRRIFGPKSDESVGDWRKLHNDELHNFYCSQVSGIRWAGHEERIAKREIHRGFRRETQR